MTTEVSHKQKAGRRHGGGWGLQSPALFLSPLCCDIPQSWGGTGAEQESQQPCTAAGQTSENY